uniref:TIR domain-containing protein n=2 Tax=Chrysotila carterae TaxID=13221 RepID=A0A7S4BMV6_CHRCT
MADGSVRQMLLAAAQQCTTASILKSLYLLSLNGRGALLLAASTSAIAICLAMRKRRNQTEAKEKKERIYRPRISGAKWVACICREREACPVESLWVQAELEAATQADVYLDCEDTYDAMAAADRIRQSAVLVVMQTHRIFTSAHRIFEVLTAIRHGVPLIMVRVEYGEYRYDIEHESTQLQDLARRLSTSTYAFLEEHGFSRRETVETISLVVPSLISISFDSSAMRGALFATSQRIAQLLESAQPWTLHNKASVLTPLPHGLRAIDTHSNCSSPRSTSRGSGLTPRSRNIRQNVMVRSPAMDALPLRPRSPSPYVAQGQASTAIQHASMRSGAFRPSLLSPASSNSSHSPRSRRSSSTSSATMRGSRSSAISDAPTLARTTSSPLSSSCSPFSSTDSAHCSTDSPSAPAIEAEPPLSSITMQGNSQGSDAQKRNAPSYDAQIIFKQSSGTQSSDAQSNDAQLSKPKSSVRWSVEARCLEPPPPVNRRASSRSSSSSSSSSSSRYSQHNGASASEGTLEASRDVSCTSSSVTSSTSSCHSTTSVSSRLSRASTQCGEMLAPVLSLASDVGAGDSQRRRSPPRFWRRTQQPAFSDDGEPSCAPALSSKGKGTAERPSH